VTFLIGIEVASGTYAGGQPFRVLVYGGNIQGEVYIYEITNLNDSFNFQDDTAPTPKA